MTINFLVSRIS